MIRRDAIVGLLGLLATPFSWLVGKKEPESSLQPLDNPSMGERFLGYSGREVRKKTPEGLKTITWDEIEPGDEIVAFDWVAGRIVGIMHVGQAILGPNTSLPDNPVVFENTNYMSISCLPTRLTIKKPGDYTRSQWVRFDKGIFKANRHRLSPME